MKYLITFIILITCNFALFAQTETKYLDINFKETNAKKSIYKMQESQRNDTVYKLASLKNNSIIVREERYHKTNPDYKYITENYINGMPKVEGAFYRTKKSGLWKYYSDWGMVGVSRMFVDDIENGLRIKYHINGVKKSEEEISRGKVNGKVIYYWKTGIIQSQGTIIYDTATFMNKFVGYYKTYDETGLLIKSANFINGFPEVDSTFDKVGLVKIVTIDVKTGTYLKQEDFENGKLVSSSSTITGIGEEAYDSLPKFKGGDNAYLKYLKDNLIYPDWGLKPKEVIRRLVMVQFDENGIIVDIEPVGEFFGYGFDKATYEVLSKMPPWIPGQKNGKAVKSGTFLAVDFK